MLEEQDCECSTLNIKNALEATKAGYIVGTRTMVDVLNDLTTVYSAQNKYVDDQYTYLNNIIALKASSGVLSVEDLAEINRWLNKNIKFALPRKFYGGHVPATPKLLREDRVFGPDAIRMIHRRPHVKKPDVQMVKLRLKPATHVVKKKTPAVALPPPKYVSLPGPKKTHS